MRSLVAALGLAALGIALAVLPANSESVMKLCGDQWKTAKAAGTTNGETWPQFLSQCRAQQKGGEASTTPTAAPAPAAPASSFGPASTSAGVKTASQCNEEYAANKAAIRASGQTKRAFVAACRAGNETIPQGAAAAPTQAPTTGSLFPWSQPAAPAPAPANYNPAPAPATYNPAPAATGAGQFASDQQARTRCPSDIVVWVNTRSRIYHFAGTRDYGNTKQGA